MVKVLHNDNLPWFAFGSPAWKTVEHRTKFFQCLSNNSAELDLMFCKFSFLYSLSYSWNPFICFYLFLHCEKIISSFAATSFWYCHSIACNWIYIIHAIGPTMHHLKAPLVAYGPPTLLSITWTGSSALEKLAHINSSMITSSLWLTSSAIFCKYFHFFTLSGVAFSPESTGRLSLVWTMKFE